MLKKLFRTPRRRKLAIGLAVGLLVLIIIAVGIWRLLPYYHAKRTIPAYLEKNQDSFRAGEVNADTFNQLALKDVSLGNPDHPLLTATTGRIHLSYAGGQRMTTPIFRQMELDDAVITMQGEKSSIRLNGIPWIDFMKQLTELPAAPDGSMIPLNVKGDFQREGAQKVPMLFSVTPGAQPEEFIFAGEWHGAGSGGDESCKWEVIYARNTDTLSISLNGTVAPPVWKEILRQAHEPELMAALIYSGTIEGNGAFTVQLPELAVSDFSFAGTLRDATFGLPEWGLGTTKPFAFELQKNKRTCRWQAAELELNGDFPLPLHNVVIERQSKHSNVTFDADADLRGAWGLMLQSYCGANVVSNTPLMRHVKGQINAKTMAWKLDGASPAGSSVPCNLLFEDAAAHVALTATLEALSLQGKGTGSSGTLESSIGLRSLALKQPDGTFKIGGLNMHSVRQLNGRACSEEHVDFHCNKIFSDTSDGQFEITNLSGDTVVRTSAAGASKAQWVMNASTVQFVAKTKKMFVNDCRVTARTEHERVSDVWKATMNVQCGKTDSRFHDWSGSFSNLNVTNLTAVWQHGLRNAEVRFRSDSFRGESGNGKMLDGSFAYETQTGHWTGDLKAAALEVPVGTERPWSTGKCSLHAEGLGRNMPEKFSIQSDTLKVAHNGWEMNFRDSEWLVTRQRNEYSGQCSMADLHAISPKRRTGGGDTGSGTINLTLHVTPDGKVADWNADLDCKWPSWSWEELHMGGESGKIALHRGAEGAPCVLDARLQKATLLNTYFSIMAPELVQHGEYSPATGAKGNLSFTSGKIVSPDGHMELSDASLNLPWSFVADAAAATSAGTLTAVETRYYGENQGALTINLAHLNSKLVFDGTLAAARFGNAPVAMKGKIQLPPEFPKLALTLDLPKSELTMPWSLENWFPVLDGAAALKGRFAIHAELNCSPAKRVSTASVAVENSDWQIGNAVIEGVTTRADFDDLEALVTRAAFPVTARRFTWRDVELTDNRAMLALLPGNQLALNSWTGRYGQGELTLTAPAEAVYWRQPKTAADSGWTLKFNAEKIPLADLLHKLGLNAVESDAAVSGKIAARYQAGRLHFDASHVNFQTADEILKMNELENTIIRMQDPVYQAFVQSVLREVRCQEGDFEFQEEGRDLVMKIKANGYPVRPVPFVYQGSRAKSLFRPAEPGEDGFADEIQFSVKLKMLAPAYRAQ